MASRFNCSGKSFILGEYAVLEGAPALIAALGPRFELRELEAPEKCPFEPDSPAGKLLYQSSVSGECLEWRDPTQGRGGLGASSAQFLLTSLWLADKSGISTDWKDIYTQYRKITAQPVLSPSGADVVAQTLGGIVVFNPSTMEVKDVSGSSVWESVLVFTTTRDPRRKVITHEHLEEFTDQDSVIKDVSQALDYSLKAGIEAVERGDLLELGFSLNAYAAVLSDHGLECEPAKDDRLAMSRMKGVAGVKGAGALLSDLLVIALKPQASISDRVDVIMTAESRGMELVSDGLVQTERAQKAN